VGSKRAGPSLDAPSDKRRGRKPSEARKTAFATIPVGATLQHTTAGEKFTVNAERQVVSKSGAVDASIEAWWVRMKQPSQWPAQYVRVDSVALKDTPYYTTQPRKSGSRSETADK